MEFTFLLDEWLTKQGRRGKTEIQYIFPLPRVFPIASVAEVVTPLLGERHIGYTMFFNLEAVDTEKKIISSLEGEEIPYDLLVLIPPHRGARVIEESGLGDAQEWIATDRNTLEVKNQQRVFALGDATGAFSQTQGALINLVTVRGEHATYQGSSLYYYDPASVAREGVVWDVIDLCLALPLFVVAIVLSWRGSLRGRLGLCGMLFYFFYKYLQYAVMVAFNPLFLVYVTIFALSAVAFFLNLRGIDVSRLPARFPRWLFIGFTLIMSAALILLWVGGRIIPYTLAGRLPDDQAGLTTLLTTAILLWRRSAWGYLLAGISLTYGFVMCIALPAWIAVPLIQAGQINLVEAAPFVLLCPVGLYIAGRFFWSVQEEKAHSNREMASV